jgi:hypothetical protein
MKSKNLILLVFVPWFLIISSCASWQGNKNLKITTRLERKNLDRSSILVFNFNESQYTEGYGVTIARLFHLGLLNSKKFKVIGLRSDSTWDRLSEVEETRLMTALEEGKTEKYDYILLGDLIDFYYGGINPSRVKFRVRIIEVETRTTIFLAEYSKQSDAKDTTSPMSTQLSKIAIHPKQLAESMVDEVIKKL